MHHPDLSILIPVLNETGTVQRAVMATHDSAPEGLKLEIIAIDGGSTDGSWDTMKRLKDAGFIHLLIRQKAWGKGGAVMEGAFAAKGKVVAIFDADLEYDALDVFAVAAPVLQGQADIGLGFRKRNALGLRRPLRWPQILEGLPLDLGTFGLECIIKLVSGIRHSDPFCMHRCWRANLTSFLPGGTPGFGWDLDMLLTAVARKWQIIETPVSYHPRSYSMGKKLRPWRDSMDNLRVLNKHRLLKGQPPAECSAPHDDR